MFLAMKDEVIMILNFKISNDETYSDQHYLIYWEAQQSH